MMALLQSILRNIELRTPNVYDQATFDQMADRIMAERIFELEAKLLAMGEK
jgi:hypothetical protein